jgi:hypothetical protein
MPPVEDTTELVAANLVAGGRIRVVRGRIQRRPATEDPTELVATDPAAGGQIQHHEALV